MSIEQAQSILRHLEYTNQDFCFLPDGQLVSREDCKNTLAIFTPRKIKNIVHLPANAIVNA